MNANGKVKLQSLEGTIIEVDKEVAVKSKLIYTIIEGRGCNITILIQILEWRKKYLFPT
jgi:hypothetical protein